MTCKQLEAAIESLAPGVSVECGEDFDTKGKIVRFQETPYLEVRLSRESTDDNQWQAKIRAAVELRQLDRGKQI